MKGIVLAGGLGTRLLPLTKYISKQLLPVYDKPMIYYPISTLLKLGIKDILIICTTRDIDSFKILLEDGSQFGLNLKFEIQDSPNGIAEAFIIGEKFIGTDRVTLILGDNIFFGRNFNDAIKKLLLDSDQNYIFGIKVDNPQSYGVAEMKDGTKLNRIIEKPTSPPSRTAITGLYIYNNDVIDIAKSLKPSTNRNELEITDINNTYISHEKLALIELEEDSHWFDSGTHDSLILAANAVKSYENATGDKIGCIELESINQGFLTKDALIKLLGSYKDSEYKKFLENL